MTGTERKTMAEVLAEHQLCATWEDDAGRAIICVCGIDLPTEPVRVEIDMTFLAAHQAAHLTAAGFGLVADAKGEAWDEAHFGALGCDSTCCDYMHGAPEKDMNPYRTTP